MTLDNLLRQNRSWADSIEAAEPGFFKSLSLQQAPQYFWIGCADSRVPANELVGLRPGELFVHRNVANVVSPSDLNSLACLQYAVDVLQVKHVMVVGHLGCGGVNAALNGTRVGLADNGILHVRDVISRHSLLLSGLDGSSRADVACELNVLEQARNVCNTTVIQDAWSRGQKVIVHAMVYSLDDGLLHSLDFDVEDAIAVSATYATALTRIWECKGVNIRYGEER
ncbi:carbonic anhydrase [Paraburkholderia fungorum]|uniref:carbonic anhydrase n=1 Tax=Paraburkholderia fungorum TaxID=134537 RepID=UPI00209334B8|nr:carbonic anhydrase [Paraburkholderia fungorum]USU18885.1 carbonic anhydrase [Paraburkholderia fungorum]USU29119.1 carbonic anhydrase [Paraburkholderia fungorum]